MAYRAALLLVTAGIIGISFSTPDEQAAVSTAEAAEVVKVAAVGAPAVPDVTALKKMPELHASGSMIVVPLPRPETASAESPSSKVSLIQSGIDSLLQAGNKLLVSSKKLHVGKGDTLMGLLVKNDIPRDQAYEAIQALKKIYNPRDLHPDHQITVFFHRTPDVADSGFQGLKIEQDKINSVIVNKDDRGGYSVARKEKAVYSTLRGYKGTIDGSLYVAAQRAGVPDNVLIDMIRMYSWGVDFQRDIQPGDAFEVMYEEYKTEDGDIVSGRGNIIYANMALSGRAMPFYRYEDKNGEVDYYDDSGQSAKKTLMKTPVDGARLSSGYGVRKHPVLGYNKMHKGLDFAAPRGTPIYAAGDGTIERIGRHGAYGNYIRIRHRSDLATAYAHMKGFKSGIKKGARVKQGQIIGYVGTTGRSTGPHLHYEVLFNNAQVNPSKMKMPTGRALKGNDLDTFKQIVAKYDGAFQQAVRTTPTTVASASAKTDGGAFWR